MSVCALGKITQYQYLTVKQISFSTLSLNVRGLANLKERNCLIDLKISEQIFFYCKRHTAQLKLKNNGNLIGVVRMSFFPMGQTI